MNDTNDLKLNPYIIGSNTINKMKELVLQSKFHGNEISTTLCSKIGKNEIVMRNEQVGYTWYVNILRKCPKGERFIGSFHTHPSDEIHLFDAKGKEIPEAEYNEDEYEGYSSEDKDNEYNTLLSDIVRFGYKEELFIIGQVEEMRLIIFKRKGNFVEEEHKSLLSLYEEISKSFEYDDEYNHNIMELMINLIEKLFEKYTIDIK